MVVGLGVVVTAVVVVADGPRMMLAEAVLVAFVS